MEARPRAVYGFRTSRDESRAAGRRRIDRVLDPAFTAGLPERSIEDLRASRDEAAQEETDLSYLRRLLHTRLDFLRTEQRRRASGSAPVVDHVVASSAVDTAMPPRGSEFDRTGYVDALVNVDLSDISLWSDGALEEAIRVHEAEEEVVSQRRRPIQAVVDKLNAEIARRPQPGEVAWHYQPGEDSTEDRPPAYPRRPGDDPDAARLLDVPHWYREEPALGESGTQSLPVTIYISDESIHEQVEAAVESVLESVGARIEDRDDPIPGSWFRRMGAKTAALANSPAGREAAATALHAAEAHFVHAKDADITETMMRNLPPLITALEPTKNAVVRIGAVLLVKVDGVPVVHQLTAAQQLRLDHQPRLAMSPYEILAALEIKNVGKTDASSELDSGPDPLTA